MTLLDEIRERDAKYGDHLPVHYQAQLDRRELLRQLDNLKANLSELAPYVDGGVVAWDMVERAISDD